MKKKLFLIIIVIFILTSVVEAREIDEIVIQGLTRSEEELIKRQLPYSEGDQWTEELNQLAEKRLFKMRTFNPISLEVAAEEIEKDKVKVIITAEDPNLFMFHPVEFVVFKIIDLTSEQLTQYALNPLGNGISFNAGINWSSDPWWEVGVNYAGSQGRNYSATYRDFDNTEEFNNLEYEEKGFKFEVELEQILRHDLTLQHVLNYQDNTYQQEEEISQEYLRLGTNIIYERYGCLDLGVEYGHGLVADNPEFGLISLRWDKINQFEDNKLIFSVKSGLATSDTPFNYQFKGGGYSSLPLRGTEFELVGTKYLIGNMEHHKMVVEDLFWLIAFLDTGKIVPEESSFFEQDWKLDGGGGLVLATPFGPLRADAGFDLLNDNYNLNLSLGHTF